MYIKVFVLQVAYISITTKQAKAYATKVNAVFVLKAVDFCSRLVVKISNIYQHWKRAEQSIPHTSKKTGHTGRLQRFLKATDIYFCSSVKFNLKDL